MLFGECVHNYLIKDAIFDNNVLGFHVEYIKTMEGDFDWDDPTLADAIDVNELYMSEERMSLIANHIIQNHKAKRETDSTPRSLLFRRLRRWSSITTFLKA